MSTLMLVNPRKRRKTKARRRKTITHSKNPIRRKRRSTSLSAAPRHHRRRKSYRRNPISGGTGIVDQVKGAAVGALGAIAVDLAMSKLPIPATMKSGAMLHVAQGVVSLGLGMLVAKVGKNKKLGMQLAEGGLTVALYAAAKSAVGDKLGLAGYEDLGDDLLGFQDLGDDLLGMDDDYSMGGVGWQNAAPTYDMAGGDDDVY